MAKRPTRAPKKKAPPAPARALPRELQLIPSAVSVQARPDDPRVGTLLQSAWNKGKTRIALLGFPTDCGVRRNGGRPGAAQGPDAIRAAFYRLTPDVENPTAFSELLGSVLDLGNLRVTEDLEADQEALGTTIHRLLLEGVTPIVLGGGHETSFGHFLGYASAGRSISVINWDAHPDVRPLLHGKGHSGSPFRQCLTHPSKRCRGYSVFGLLPHSTAHAHLQQLKALGGRALLLDRIDLGTIENAYARLESEHFVSFDLDLLDGSIAPGVSAPAVGGMGLSHWLMAAERAGATKQVRSIDIVECNPLHDLDGRTARIAALTVWRFLRGFLQRS